MATKHTIDSDAERPTKKSKVVAADDADKARLKKEKKDKKREKKEKRKAEAEAEDDAEPETTANAADELSEEQKKADKAARKAAKKAKKEKKAAAAASTNETEEEKPAKKQKAVSGSSGSSKYEQTDALSSIPQADIDAFLSTNQIVITDPRTKTNTLRPITEFAQIPATALIAKNPFSKYTKPTPIQSASWPFTLSGRDVVGVAETGSGKTMAFALPCIEALTGISYKGTKAVVVSPTRELAMQTHEQMAAVAKLVGLKCVCLYGGASKDDQRNLLSYGADVIVATPGRLKDFMSDGTVDLSRAQFVVLDEADRMLDKGFEEDIKQILGECPAREKRQTLMFTATWPYSVQSLASTFMVEPVKITIGSGGKETENGSVELQANTRITQHVEVLDPKDKEYRLMQVLKEHQQGSKKNDRILVFCLYKKEATRVEMMLQRKGVKVCGIHGDLRQEQRTRSLEAFKSGETPVLVATDVAARGLDIPEVKLVINVTVS